MSLCNVVRWCSGTLARKTELGRLENTTHVLRIYRLPSIMDSVYVTSMAYLQQSPNHQIYVILDVARLLNASATNGCHHAVLQSSAAEFVSILV